MRREHEQYAQRRRLFLAWADSQAKTLGVMIPARRIRAGMEVRFANVNPAVSLLISSTSICVTVSYAGRHCDLVTFDSAPRRVIGRYEDDLVMPVYAVVYPDQHSR